MTTPRPPLDPELDALAALLPPVDLSGDLAPLRAATSAAMAQMPAYRSTADLTVHELTVPGPTGAPEVAVRTYVRTAVDGPVPAVLFLHGGAFVQGDLGWGDNTCRQVADRLGVLVVNVGYRLAPEDPYPAALEDCYAVLQWVAAEAGPLGVVAERIAVLGESAGGGIAAGLTLLARHRGGPALAAQVLDAPTVDDRLDTPSMRAFTDTPGWRATNAPPSWRRYLAGTAGPGQDDVPVYAAPHRATSADLVGSPPAYVVAYEVDPTRDEVIDHARHLLEAGVPTELHVYSGAFHLAHVFPGTAIGTRMTEDRLAAIARLLAVG